MAVADENDKQRLELAISEYTRRSRPRMKKHAQKKIQTSSSEGHLHAPWKKLKKNDKGIIHKPTPRCAERPNRKRLDA